MDSSSEAPPGARRSPSTRTARRDGRGARKKRAAPTARDPSTRAEDVDRCATRGRHDAGRAGGQPAGNVAAEDGAFASSLDRSVGRYSGSSRRTVSYVVGSAGLLAVGVGSIFGIRALSRRHASDQLCPTDDTCSPDGIRLNNEAKTAARTADAFVAAVSWASESRRTCF